MKNEKIIDAWDKLSPSADEKLRILGKVCEGQGIDKRRGISVRSLLIAAVILALGTVSVVASSSEVRRIVFGESLAIQQEIVNEPNWGSIVTTGDDGYLNLLQSRLRVYSTSLNLYERLGEFYRDFPFSPSCVLQDGFGVTIEESNLLTRFAIKEPVYLPSPRSAEWSRGNMRILTHSLVYLEGDDYAYGAILTYHGPSRVSYEADWRISFMLSQWYVGEEGYFEVITADPIQKVMISGIETLLMEHLIHDPSGILTPISSDTQMIQRELIWMMDGVVYSMISISGTRDFIDLDLETKIAIAESIR